MSDMASWFKPSGPKCEDSGHERVTKLAPAIMNTGLVLFSPIGELVVRMADKVALSTSSNVGILSSFQIYFVKAIVILYFATCGFQSPL